MKSLRVGVIGSGFGASVHAPAFSRLRNCRVAARADSSSWKSVVKNPSIDIVSIAVPPGPQAVILKACARSGKNVFFEKPLCANRKEALEIRKAAGKSEKKWMIDFEFPELKSWQACKRLVKHIGAVRHASIDWQIETYANRMGLESWRTNAGLGGGALGAFGSHAFYNLEWFFGPAKKVSAFVWRFEDARGDAETAFSAIFQMKAGFPVFVNVSTHSSAERTHRVSVFGNKGSLRLQNLTADYIRGFKLCRSSRDKSRWEEVKIKEMKIDAHDGRLSAVSGMVRRFVRSVAQNKKAAPGLEEALRVQRLMDCVRESSRSGKWVNCAK